jgi:antitoxin component YwqK of YwqJK toxin-antitoxin module
VFKRGLKYGVWKSWKEDGTLIEAVTWKNGVIVPKEAPSFIKKINIFKKKPKQAPNLPDTLSKPKK